MYQSLSTYTLCYYNYIIVYYILKESWKFSLGPQGSNFRLWKYAPCGPTFSAAFYL